jgi:hypothetical protein
MRIVAVSYKKVLGKLGTNNYESMALKAHTLV